MGLNIEKFVGAVVGIIVAVENRKSLSSYIGFGSLSRYGGHRNTCDFDKHSSRHCDELRIHQQYARHHPVAYCRWNHHGSRWKFPVLS